MYVLVFWLRRPNCLPPYGLAVEEDGVNDAGGCQSKVDHDRDHVA